MDTYCLTMTYDDKIKISILNGYLTYQKFMLKIQNIYFFSRLESIPNQVFINLTYLMYLDVSNNRLGLFFSRIVPQVVL